jgi:hypothetical protein
MTTREEAVEQLRVIRTMMERATIFRALSGETALVGGAIALGVAWLSERRTPWEWAWIWMAGLGLALCYHGYQLYRMKVLHQPPLWSSGLKMALRGGLPALVVGGFLGLVYIRAGNKEAAACMWIAHYGLALLAIREFAPKSMVWLGWAFVVFGLVCLATVANIVELHREWAVRVNASRLMAIAFGGFHLIYGGLIVTTGRREESKA